MLFCFCPLKFKMITYVGFYAAGSISRKQGQRIGGFMNKENKSIYIYTYITHT